ncbi:MAG: dihydroorotase [Chloroflexota bacterium]|nr:dihydroorotase [Chloroflexota bacterium]
MLIQGGRILDPSLGIDQVGDLLIDGGKVVQLGSVISQGEVEKIDAAGLVVSPGFVDLHCHLREPGFEDKETIATGTRAAAAGGFTTICCMGNTNPPLDERAIVDWVKQKADKEGLVDVLPIGCITRERKGKELCDMAELADAGVIAFSDDGNPVSNSQVMRDAMEHGSALGLAIIDHCEDKALSRAGVMNEGRLSASLGLKGVPAAAEEIMIARDLALAKLTGARLHIAHVSTRGAVELIRHAKEEGIAVTSEVTPHHLTLTEKSIIRGGCDTNAKVNPPLRTEDDIICLIEGLRDGVIDVVATDHAPHTLADKDCELALAAFGISGFETAFGCLMGLVDKGEIGLVTLISKLTGAPAMITGRDKELGSIGVGMPANVVIFDPDQEWTVDSRRFASKGKNTPLEGCRLKGKVVTTIANGRIVYMDKSRESRLLPFAYRSGGNEKSHV